jgi:FkbM family methyltransferase
VGAVTDALRRLSAHRRVLPITALLLRGRCVRETTRFVVREGGGRHGLCLYTLRESGLRVALRHGTGDVVTLGEVFHERDYEPPAEVVAALGEPASILDLGANVGLFGAFAAARWPAARIEAFEPDPVNANVCERTIAANGLAGRWTLTRTAAGNADGRIAFAAGIDALSHEVAPGTPGAIVVPIVDVLERIGAADLVKVDIEGGEWAIAGDPRFAAHPPAAIVLEYHPSGCPAADPHAAMRGLLAAAGLQVHDIWRRDDGHGMVWAWRG